MARSASGLAFQRAPRAAVPASALAPVLASRLQMVGRAALFLLRRSSAPPTNVRSIASSANGAIGDSVPLLAASAYRLELGLLRRALNSAANPVAHWVHWHAQRNVTVARAQFTVLSHSGLHGATAARPVTAVLRPALAKSCVILPMVVTFVPLPKMYAIATFGNALQNALWDLTVLGPSALNLVGAESANVLVH
jgi:hypothetical protein